MNKNEIEWASFLAASRIVMRESRDSNTVDEISAIIRDVFASVQQECGHWNYISSSVQEDLAPERVAVLLELPKRDR